MNIYVSFCGKKQNSSPKSIPVSKLVLGANQLEPVDDWKTQRGSH